MGKVFAILGDIHSNIEALDAWTVVCPEKGVRVKRAGHVLTAEVSSGFMIIMR